ncbi:MAG: hypothetical protein ACUVTO_09840 [Candidatus Caldatribacteriaceae bacterium]
MGKIAKKPGKKNSSACHGKGSGEIKKGELSKRRILIYAMGTKWEGCPLKGALLE